MVPELPPTEPGQPGAVRIVFVTAPPDTATELARRLVEERLAACANVIPGLRSIFRWKGAVQDEPETLLVMKTQEARLTALMERVLALHPHDTPEVIALEPSAGLPAYLAWVVAETTADEAPE